jgi:hypothetical protein
MRFERGEVDLVSIQDLGAWCATVGMDLAMRGYPAGDALRDAGQVRLLGRLRVRLAPDLDWRTEVPLPIPGDLRAWDAVIAAPDWQIPVEAETVLADLQAVERRITLKLRDGGVDRLVLLIADTPRNRAAVSSSVAFQTFDRDARDLLHRLGTGRRPDRSVLLFL